MFLDREQELALLEQCYSSEVAELFVLYGRRRVGKTELLGRFCEGKRYVFYVADQDAEPRLRAGLSAEVNTRLLGEAAASAVYPTWEALFRLLASHAQHEPLVVVLDEFTYLLAAHPPLASILQRLWDSELRHTRLKLVLCGSHIGMMESEVLGYQAPLYGRRTGQALLEPLGFHDARAFCPSYSAEDQVRAFAVFGGTPAYLTAAQLTAPLVETIQSRVLQRGTFFYDEVRFLLQQELREPRNYFAVLEAIAGGRTRQNEIKQATGIDGVSAYLGTLQELKLVERIVPVTETQPHKSRRGIYRLRDPFFRFWLRFVHANRTLLERGGAQVVLETKVVPQLDAFTGPAFEQVCEQFVWRLGLSGRLPLVPERVGGWWGGDAEIDLIALGGDAAMAFECRWSSRPVGTDILARLEARTTALAGVGDRAAVWYGLCSRSGFTAGVRAVVRERSDVRLFDLAAIVAG